MKKSKILSASPLYPKWVNFGCNSTDHQGYKHLFTKPYSITEAGCMAHALRKFFELSKSNQSQIAHQALQMIGQLYAIEAELKPLEPEQRQIERER